MRPELPAAVTAAPPTGWRVWWTAARPRTLGISVTPVLVGGALAWSQAGTIAWLPLLASMLCAMLIQVGTNLHNDAADFERGTDQPDRIGPLRVTAAGWARPGTVRLAAAISFAMALGCGTYLAAVGGWPIVVIGLVSLVAGWAYSGGPMPISHTPLGEAFVLLFFGIVAVAGSHWLQLPSLPPAVWIAGCIVGLPAAAVLLINNYRDYEGDARSGRHTLAVLIGRDRSRFVYALLMFVPYGLLLLLAAAGRWGALLGLLALPLSLSLVRRLWQTMPGRQLNLLLADTARAGFVLGLLLAVGLLA